MARSTGPILAMGALVIANKSLINGQAIDWRVPIATGLTAGAFAVLEKGWAEAAVATAWLAFVVSMFVRPDSRTPALVESLDRFWSTGSRAPAGPTTSGTPGTGSWI